MANGLALSLSADFCEERVREEVISPAELVSIDVEGDGGSDRLTREARSTRRLGSDRLTREARRTRRLGSLTTPRTRSGSAGRSLVVRRRNDGGLPMEHAEDVVHMRRRIVEGHNRIGVVGSVGGSG